MRFLIILISLLFITKDSLKSDDILSDSIVVGVESEMVSGSGILPYREQPITFAFLTDLHVSPGSAGDTSLYRLVDEINQTNVDFTIVTGDLSNSGSDAELLAVKKALDKLIKPCYVLPGNHETNWSESAGLTFNKLWGNDRFLFNLKGYLFVGFNTGPFMKMGNGYVKQEDLLWLKRQLQNEKMKNQVLISFTHYPLSDGLDNWVQVTDLLNSFGCRIDFCGHGHQLALFNFNGIPGIMGRAVLSGNSTIPGYNIVKLRNDSVLIYNKELSRNMRKPFIALNYMKADTLSTMAISKVPDFSVNQVYTNRKVVVEWSDTASIFSGPCLVNDTILVYGNSLGLVNAINIRSQRIIWQTKIPGPLYSTPVASDGRIVLGTVDGNVIALDALKGRQLWVVKTGRPVLAEGIIEEGFVYIGGGNRDFYKINMQNGNIVWQFSGVAGLIQGKSAVSGSSVIFGAWDRYLYCLEKNTGVLKWKWNNGNLQKLYSPGNIFPVCSDNKVFIVAPDRYMTAIDIASGKEIWRTSRHQVRESMGASPDGSMVYAKLMNDTVIAMSALGDFPKTLWAVNAGFGYEHNPCPVMATNDLVIAGTANGLLVAIDPKTRMIAWKYKAGNSLVNKVIVDQHQTFWFTLTEGKVLGIKSIF
jgi:outer membrane protein assembly factor BamB/Icc-related predicted phosphoesterase